MLCVQGLWFTAVMPGIDRWSLRYFRILFIVLLLLCLSGFIETVLFFYPVPIGVFHLLMILETLLLSLPLPMMTVYLLHCCGENGRSGRLLYTVLALWAVFFVILVSAPFTSLIYIITPERQYSRGPWYPILLVPVTAAAGDRPSACQHHGASDAAALHLQHHDQYLLPV